MTSYGLSYRPAGPLSGDGWIQKYPGEHHFPGYAYLGPNTRRDIRLDENYKPRPGEEPINKLDTIALAHDIDYDKIKKEYAIDGDRKKALDKIHNSDQRFINEASAINQPLAKISAGIIKTKMALENNNIIDTKTFSGMGVSFKTKSGKEISFVKKPKKQDPTERLKKLAGMGVCKPKNKKQSGGLAPLAISLITSLAGVALGKLFDLVKEKLQGKISDKLQGKGIDTNLYKTDEQKRQFLLQVLK